MKFGEKLRMLRKKHRFTQAELAKEAGLGLKTITNYEKGTTYPQNREVYAKLANILKCDTNYLRNEEEDFLTQTQQEFGYPGKAGAKKLLTDISSLFAGGDMAEEDMDELMLAIQEAYIDAKRKNKKYAPKKYRSQESSDSPIS